MKTKEEMVKYIKELEDDNNRLRRRLQRYEKDIDLNITLTSDEKVSVYMEYFKGRNDIMAIRYYSNKNQRFSYAPLCFHDFDDRLCMKAKGKKINCLKCPNRDFMPYTKALLNEHFKPKKFHKIINKEVCLGIYPLLPNGMCYFVAIDFDENDWMNEMLCVYRVARRFQIDPLLERSQSGQGGHLWIFFQDAISAVKARNLAKMLLKIAMRENKDIDMKSFDRIFPNQDYVTNDGLGNLIALPLHYNAFCKGNSAFINEAGIIIHKQVEYLSTIEKLTESDIDRILMKDDAIDYFYDGNQVALSLYDDVKYSKHLVIIENSMLQIKKNTCNALTLNMIKRMSSLVNPEYILKKKLHKPIFNTPYILSEYEETDQYIYIPRGLKEKLNSVFANAFIEIYDETIKGKNIDFKFKGELYNHQQEAINELLLHDIGMLHASAGFGKTVMAVYAMAEKHCSTLIIVPNLDLKKQWIEMINQFSLYPQSQKKKDSFIGEYTGSKKNLKGNLDIATIQSLANCNDLDILLEPYGMVIIDECHHIPAQSFRIVLKNIKAKYIYGFSATPDRQDGLEKVIYMYCGPKRYQVNKKKIIAEREFQQVLIPHFTNIKLLDKKDTYQEIIDEIYINEHRNFMIAKDIISACQKGRRCIVLSERVDHLKILFEKIRDVSPYVYILSSGMSKKQRNKIFNELDNLSIEKGFVLLSTSKLLGEGFDYASLDTLFLTLPVSDKNRISQYTGRIHRKYVGKKIVYVHDYVDIHIPMLETMFHKRLKAYHDEGYIDYTTDQKDQRINYIFDSDTYVQALEYDFHKAQKEIVVYSEKILLNKFKLHFDLIQKTAENGIHITFITSEKDIDAELKQYINGSGATILKKNIKKKLNFVIIDKTILWYGDMNIFGRIKSESTLIRINNKMLSEEIFEDIM